jgi:regulation of enolase protein 1 (concanavalin A-like superfamily)
MRLESIGSSARMSAFDGMGWLNEPPSWSIERDVLVVSTGEETDFWRETFYGFVRDNGHFLFRQVSGDFTAEVTIGGAFAALYDQSGLMMRADERHWVKTGIELTDGVPHLSTVVTNVRSDWSVVPLPTFSGSLRCRLTRHGEAVRTEYLRPDGEWRLLRLGYLDIPARCDVGVMCCSPQRGGFEARFEAFGIREPIPGDLHS